MIPDFADEAVPKMIDKKAKGLLYKAALLLFYVVDESVHIAYFDSVTDSGEPKPEFFTMF